MSLNIPATTRKRVVVIGGGFGGMKLIDSLRRSGFQLVLIDQNNYHQFQPLLYQVATAGLNPGSIAFPFRKDFRHIPDFHFRMARVTRIVPRENQIETTIGNYYGMQNIQAHALPMKSVTEAMALRNHILTKFEEALTADDATKRQRLLNLVVVGGGATGVEISGALAEMKRYVLQKDYPDLTSATLHIYLVEGTSKVLGNMSPEASEKAGGFLSRMGVKLLLDTRVTDYRDGAIVLANGESIPTETVIWVSGVTARLFEGIPEAVTGKGGRILTDEFCRVKNQSNIFAIGDIAQQNEPAYPNGHPQVAQVALQQGKLLARNLCLLEHHQPPLPFHYRDKGTLATVGRNKAVADLPHLKTQGFVAWWLSICARSWVSVTDWKSYSTGFGII